MTGPLYPVHDDYGREIGTVERTVVGDRNVWRVTSLDGCDLGAYADRDDAHYAIRDDWDAGRPRDPVEPKRRFRPMLALANGFAPVYLGR